MAGIDKNGQMELLGFPPFHEDLITQGWWDAGQDLGRIKVIIAEGIAQQTSYHMTWERKRNIVAFAFVHAPLGKFTLCWLRSATQSQPPGR